MHEANQPSPTTFGEPILPEIPVVSEVTSLQAASRASLPASPNSDVATEVPPPPVQVSAQVESLLSPALIFLFK